MRLLPIAAVAALVVTACAAWIVRAIASIGRATETPKP